MLTRNNSEQPSSVTNPPLLTLFSLSLPPHAAHQQPSDSRISTTAISKTQLESLKKKSKRLYYPRDPFSPKMECVPPAREKPPPRRRHGAAFFFLFFSCYEKGIIFIFVVGSSLKVPFKKKKPSNPLPLENTATAKRKKKEKKII